MMILYDDEIHVFSFVKIKCEIRSMISAHYVLRHDACSGATQYLRIGSNREVPWPYCQKQTFYNLNLNFIFDKNLKYQNIRNVVDARVKLIATFAWLWIKAFLCWACKAGLWCNWQRTRNSRWDCRRYRWTGCRGRSSTCYCWWTTSRCLFV
jgi:hypothetical protein